MSASLFYHRLNAWGTDPEWRHFLPSGEEPECIALGKEWVAVATSNQLVRVLSHGGVQTALWSVGGPVVCVSGWEHALAVVSHAPGSGSAFGAQRLHVSVYDMKRRVRVHSGECPLTPGATLKWIGWAENGVSGWGAILVVGRQSK